MEQDEQLIVSAPAWEHNNLLFDNMGQDEPAVPVMCVPLEINTHTHDAEQTTNQSEPVNSECVPTASSKTDVPDETGCPVPSFDAPQHPVPVTDPVILHPAPVDPQPQYDGVLDQQETTQKTKVRKSKPPVLKIKAPLNETAQTNEEGELPVPKATYNFDPSQLDDSFNPFTCGGSKIQNSPPPCGPSSLPRPEPLGGSLPVCVDVSAAPAEDATSEVKPVMLEFSLDEGTVSRAPPRKLGGRRTSSKLATKKQKPKVSETSSKPAAEPTTSEPESQPVSAPATETTASVSDSTAPLNLDDVPIPKKGSYNFDPSQWNDPNFNPFGSNSQVSTSPVLPKGSYSFDPDNFDAAVDPFSPSATLSTDDSPSCAAPPGDKLKDGGKQRAGDPPAEKKVRQLPKKSKDRTIK